MMNLKVLKRKKEANRVAPREEAVEVSEVAEEVIENTVIEMEMFKRVDSPLVLKAVLKVVLIIMRRVISPDMTSPRVKRNLIKKAKKKNNLRKRQLKRDLMFSSMIK
jgi:hypothetical protein